MIAKFLSTISSGNNVRLHPSLGLGCWVTAGHDTLVERTFRTVRVIAANTQDYGAFLAHRVVSRHAGTGSIEEGRQLARCGVSTTNRPMIRLAFNDGRHETEGDCRVVRIFVWIGAGEETVLEICHNPRTRTRAFAPEAVVTEIDCFHMAIPVVIVIRLSVTIVEAARIVVVSPVENGIDALKYYHV